MSLQISMARASVRRGYAGDPGLGSLLKKGLGLVSKAGIPGVSGVAGLVGGSLLRASKPVTFKLPPAKELKDLWPVSGPGLPGLPPLPGGRPFAPPGMGIEAVPGSAQPGGRPAGMRLNKTGYFLRTGEFVAPGTRWVKIRRRNALNPRALDRAMGRLTSAKRAAVKLQRISIRSDCPPRRRRAAPAPAKRGK